MKRLGLALLFWASAAAAESDPLADRFGGPFALEDHTGRAVSEADFRGVYLLMTFGYTSCPDVCPVTLGVVTAAMEALGPAAGRVRPIFVSVDPGRDTPAVLADYVALFHPRLVGLTGTEAQVADVARAWRVHRRKVFTDPDDREHWLVDHGSLVYLMDPDGRFLTLFPYGTNAARMADVVCGYLPVASGCASGE